MHTEQSFTATATNDHARKEMSVSGAFETTVPYGTGSGPVKYGNLFLDLPEGKTLDQLVVDDSSSE